MNFYSYSPHEGMHYHNTGKEAKEAAATALHVMQNSRTYDEAEYELVTWGEVTARAAHTPASYILKRQELLSYESAHPQIVDGRMENAVGDLVLLKNIHDSDLLEHDLVLNIATIWENLSGKIARFKQHNFEDVTTFVDLLFENWSAKRGGREGNMSFNTVDRRWMLKICIQKTIDFGPEIHVAQSKLTEALEQMTDRNSDLTSIVTSAFTLVDGKLNVAAMLRLRKLKIGNELWNEGMKIIDAAIEVISSKKQIRLYKRNDQGQYDAVSLNIAAL